MLHIGNNRRCLKLGVQLEWFACTSVCHNLRVHTFTGANVCNGGSSVHYCVGRLRIFGILSESVGDVVEIQSCSLYCICTLVNQALIKDPYVQPRNTI